MGKHVSRNGYCANREYFLSCPSPQLRMSFIVFSTEGRILMSLTEDRWVQIPSERLLIPLLSVMQLKGMSLIPDLDTGHIHTVMIPLSFFCFVCFFAEKTFQADTFLFFSLSIMLVWTSASFCCFCGQFMSLIFPQQTFSAATKSFHRFTATL